MANTKERAYVPSTKRSLKIYNLNDTYLEVEVP